MKEQIPPILRPEHVKPILLHELAIDFDLPVLGARPNVALTGISMNTNDLREGDLFVAMPGIKTHGAKFASKALAQGAKAIITDRAGHEILVEELLDSHVPIALLESPREHLGDLAAYVYGNSGEGLPLMFGTTGTNGKTSTTYILDGILRQLGLVTGLTSTAERHIAGEVIVSRLTTPESTEMQALIARMREKQVDAISIEVSAQALSQLRVDGIHFDVVGFTNLSHDHFDDYDGFDDYLAAKAKLFTSRRAGRGVVSLDSEFGARVVELSEVPTVTVSSKGSASADYSVRVTGESANQTEFELTTPTGVVMKSSVPIIGAHMAANAGLAIAMLISAGIDENKIAQAIQTGIDTYLPGRTELVSPAEAPNVFVDFGHSPDAFANTLAAVRKVTPGKVIMLFGADGDRDASKRPDMAKVSAELCDILVITDHHPRFEDPASIRATLVSAAKAHRPELAVYEVSPPEQAIRFALSLAQPGDSILWAGPGHQDYRDIEGVRTPYSARQEARAALRELGYA